MNFEIERKFLVCGDFRPEILTSTSITQGYLSIDPARTVRVRILSNRGFLTIKGPADASGCRRYEWEHEIAVEQAHELMALSLPGKIEKIRHEVRYSGNRFEVDEFFGSNQGLVIAEVELAHIDQAFDRPSWLGTEVTGEPKYYNSALVKRPFSSW